MYIGLATASKSLAFGPYRYTGTREYVQKVTVQEALLMLRRIIIADGNAPAQNVRPTVEGQNILPSIEGQEEKN